MKIFVDNNPPVINIDDFYVDTVGNEPNCCGFVQYNSLASNIHLEFTAKQKNDFALFSAQIAGYEATDTDSDIESGAASLQMVKSGVGLAPTFTGNSVGKYTGDIPVAGALVGCVVPDVPVIACTKKVVGIGLSIEWFAHNGTSRLWGARDSRSTAFAIESV